MAKIAWKSFPYPATDYDFPGTALQKRWSRLHQGDCEPYPAAAILSKLISIHPDLKPSMSVEQAANTLQAAWRAYHYGDFGQAIGLGLSIGPLGYNVANKAANIYATYLEGAEKRRLALFLESVKRVAVLGMRGEKHADRPAFYVPAYLASAGVELFPVPTHADGARSAKRGSSRGTCSSSRASAVATTGSPRASRTATSAGSRSRVPWPRSRSCCCSTSRRPG